MHGGKLRYVLGARILTSEFSAVLRRQQPPPDGVIALMDAGMTIMSRTRAEDVYIGGKPSADFSGAIRGSPRGLAAIADARRDPVLVSLEHVRADGLDRRTRACPRLQSTGRSGARCRSS